jgi:hypothetical protein
MRIYQGIAHVHLPLDPRAMLSATGAEARRLAADWAQQGLDVVAAETTFDVAPVRVMVERAGSHEGIYRETRDKPAVMDALGRRWTPVFEWDEAASAFFAEARDSGGDLVGREIVVSYDRPWGVFNLPPFTARRTGNAVEYMTRDGYLVGRLPLVATPVASTARGDDPPLPDTIPPAIKPGRGDMPLDEFWSLVGLVDLGHAGDHEAAVEPLLAELASRSRRERHTFDSTLARLLFDIDGRAWARRMGEGWYGEPDNLSTDVFLYARCAVVARGRIYYERVRRDPTAMRPDEDFEAILYAASRAHERQTGGDDEFEPRVSYETFSNSAGWD